jgi:NitT/TauT family transport system ATP-binding protein
MAATAPDSSAGGAPASAPGDAPFLSLSEVSKAYRSARGAVVRACEDVSFSLGRGEFVSVVGPSGCGKSTLLMMVAGLLRQSSGQIEIEGEAVKGPHPKLGIVFQRDALLEWRTVLRNVVLQAEVRGLDLDIYRERAKELLAVAGLEGFEDRYPYELSGGMRQRVSICRAMLHEPELLLMDEPFGALDALTRERMSTDLAAIHERERASVLFITHSIPEAVLLSDRIVVMTSRPGRIAEIIDVTLPRPRRHADLEHNAEFDSHLSHLRELFAEEGVLTR